MIEQTVTIVNKRGLHARAAAKFVKLAATFESKMEVTRNDTTVSADSIMGLMMLAAAPGCTIQLTAEGGDEELMVKAISELIENRFDED